MSKIQNEDVKSLAQLTGAGGSISQLINDTKIYVTSGGINKQLSQAITDGDIGGGSGINYVANGRAESDTTGWSIDTYGSGTTRPAGSLTGVTTGITFSVSGTAPLYGNSSFLLSKDAANRQGRVVYYGMTFKPAHFAKVMQVSMDYIVNSGTFAAGSSSTDSDLIVYLHDVTNNVFIEPSSFKFLSNSSSISDKFIGNFQTSANGTSYRLLIYVASTSASAYELKFDNVQVSPSVYVYGTPITDWISYTPTGSWSTNTTYTGKWRQVGDSMEVEGLISLAGAPTSATLTINLPTGYSIDTNKLSGNSTGAYPIVGLLVAADIGSTYYQGYLNFKSTTDLYAYVSNTSGTYNNAAPITQAVPFTFGNTDAVYFSYKVPIVGFSSSTQVSDGYDGRQIGFRANNSSTTINSTPAKIVWTNVDKDDVAGYSSGTYTVRSSGWYDVDASLYISGTPSVDQTSQIFIYRNGSAIKSFTHRYKVAAATTTSIGPVADSFFFNSGDTIEIYASSELASAAISSDGTRNTVFIGKRQSPTTISATYVVAASYRHSSNQSLTSAGIIIFNDKLIDTHNAYNTSTGIFTAPYSGNYEISFQVLSINATQQMTVAMRKNSSTIVRASGLAFFSTGTTIVNNNQTAILHPLQISMNAGETFDVYNTVGVASGTVYNSGVDSWLTIKMVK